jgi:hypothetical protein
MINVEIGWDLQNKVIVATIPDTDFPQVRGYLKLVFLTNNDFPIFLVEFHRIDFDYRGSYLTSKELLEKIRHEVLKEIVSTLGESFYFIDDYEENSNRRLK